MFKKNNTYNKPSNTRKILVIIVAFLLIGTIVVAAYLYGKNSIDQTTTNNDTTDGINYDPPTEEELVTNEEKEALTNTDNENSLEATKPVNNKTSTDVVITDANQYDSVIEVRAFMPNVIENGTCNVVFTKDGVAREEKVPAKADATTTICINLELDSSSFASKGTWSVYVTYESNTYSGQSATKEITIK